MKATELRIGNWVNYYKKRSVFQNQIYCINYSTCTIGDHVVRDTMKYRNLEPIPLTEEWLVKFGFDKSVEYGYYTKITDKGKEFILNGDFYMCDINLPVEIRTVHHLQNLYSALTSEELTIKEPVNGGHS